MNYKKLIALLFVFSTYQLYAQQKPNIIFIAVDDLRPELGCYGSDAAITPNIDAVAAQGILFKNAFCQQAVCSPSRASIMTGARPETIKIIENYTDFRDVNPDIITLPQNFRNNGYETVYVGKVFHNPYTDEELSWSRKADFDKVPLKRPGGGYLLPENKELQRKNRSEMIAKYGEAAKYGIGNGPAYESADVSDEAYEDGYNTLVAIETMKNLVKSNKPFFLGLGFHRPHLNWNVPKKYWDLYDENDIALSSQKNAPKNYAAMGLHPSFELRVRAGIPKTGPISDSLARVLKHAYLASVSYVDAQIGKMTAAIKEAGIADNTIIVIWGDNGYHLGDMGIWGKGTDYEPATRVPLIVSAPNVKEKGYKTDALVEMVDIFPTLCDLASIAKPNTLEGQSFVPLLENPKLPWKKAAFSVFPSPALREWGGIPLRPAMRETYFGDLIVDVEERIQKQQKEKWDRDLFENRLMGYAMRTKRYRLVVWKDMTDKSAQPIFLELYDHQTDPYETENIAQKKPLITKELLKQFDKGWEGNKAVIN